MIEASGSCSSFRSGDSAQPVATLSAMRARSTSLRRPARAAVLFLDEPTTGLDLPNRRRIWRFIERLRARTGMTLLLTTHYLEEADGCDRVAFIRKGRLVESGAPRLLVERLGRHMLEVEGPDLDGLVGMLEPRLGTCLRDGDVAYFRFPDEDIAAIARLQAELGSKASAWRVRRPNLNDAVSIADGKALS
jgi:ABC-2 type transport system ATP-binding protein